LFTCFQEDKRRHECSTKKKREEEEERKTKGDMSLYTRARRTASLDRNAGQLVAEDENGRWGAVKRREEKRRKTTKKPYHHMARHVVTIWPKGPKKHPLIELC